MMSNSEKIDQIEEEIKSLKSKKNKKKKLKGWVLSVIQVTFLSIVSFLIFTYVLGIAKVNQNSMQPNVQPNDIVLFNRLDKSYQVDDIVVIYHEAENLLLIKRVIALPNDVVDIIDGNLVVNSKIVISDYYTVGENVLRDVKLPLTLKENEYFVMGDNRTFSLDSRTKNIGNIKEENLIGKVFFIFRAIK